VQAAADREGTELVGRLHARELGTVIADEPPAIATPPAYVPGAIWIVPPSAACACRELGRASEPAQLGWFAAEG
jgi:hypothetical protein